MNVVEAPQEYYVGIIKLKKTFIAKLTRHCQKHRETYKIWAQWLIRTLSNPDYPGYGLLRKINSNSPPDSELIKHMAHNGVSKHIARSIYHELIDGYDKLFSLYCDSHARLFRNSQELDSFRSLLSLSSTDYDPYFLSLSGTTISMKIYRNTLQRLKSMYVGPSELFLVYLFETVFNYYILDGKGLQWSLPLAIFEGLAKFNLQGELFASPLNHYCPKYYSLFETDFYFQSQGNLFSQNYLLQTSDTKLLTKQYPPGLYEVNPPFIEEIFSKSAELVCQLMSQSDQPYGFVYIMPNWVEFAAYQYLANSPFFCQEIVLPANQHYYFEWNSQKYILATFDTIVMILGNDKFQTIFSIPEIGKVMQSWKINELNN